MDLKCEFDLVGRGTYPTERHDFYEALGKPYGHYTASPFAFHVDVLSNHYSITVEWRDATAESVTEDLKTVAANCNLTIQNLKVTPL